jgi:hypothetical protein
MRRFLVGTEISSSNIFFCGTRCALIHGRVKAPSGQNQLRAKSVHRLTDAVPVQAVPVGKEQRQPSQLGVCPWGNLIIGGNAGALARASCGHYLLRNAVVSGLKEWPLARRATECFLRSWKSAPALYSCFYVPKPSVPIFIMT